jgi:protein O-mannosyl-transferase
MNTAPDSSSRASRATPWLLLALAAITIAVYAPVRHYDFVSIDDPLYVSENPIVARGLSTDGVLWALSTGHAANWHPVTWLSHMADVQMFGMVPGRHHVTSVALHVLNTLLLFFLLARLTRRTGASACVAALFGVHPLHVESVAWVAERKDVLSTLFWFLALWAYVAFTQASGSGASAASDGTTSSSASRGASRVRRVVSYSLMIICYALGLMAKPMLVTLPIVLLLLDWWPLGRWTPGRTGDPDARPAIRGLPSALLGARKPAGYIWPLLAEKLPLVAAAAASGLITLLVQQRGGAVSNLAIVPLGHRVANAVISLGTYAMKAVWPGELSVFYRYPRSIPIIPLVASAAFLVSVTWLAIVLARRRPYVLVGWLWYLIALLPVIGLVQIGRQAMADRYTYVPLIGLFLIAVWGAWDLLARWPVRRVILPVAASVVIACYAVMARAQVGCWANSEALWQHARNVDPANYYAHNALGALASDAGRLSEAIGYFSETIRLAPDYPEAYNNLGLMYAREGRAADAAVQYRKAIELNPSLAAAHDNLGVALVALGRTGEAIPEYEAAIRLDPGAALFRSNLGAALYGQGRAADAIAPFNEALRLDPAHAPAHTGLALALTALGRLAEGVPHFAEAVRLQPGSGTAHQYYGIALAGAGRFDEAVSQLNEALRINPGNATARRALDMATAARGQQLPGAGR